jgi:hypothetical protein
VQSPEEKILDDAVDCLGRLIVRISTLGKKKDQEKARCSSSVVALLG